MGILDYWQNFRSMAYSDELLIAIGALLLIIGIIKIVRSSLTMLFWVVLSALGLTAISQGLDKSPFTLAEEQRGNISDVIGAGQELSADVLAVLCRKLDENELLNIQQNNLVPQNNTEAQ